MRRGSAVDCKFLPYQWVYCGGVYQVQKIVRSLIDDEGIFRPVHRTILLKGVHCGESPNGCGRACPLMFRDEWVVPAPPPAPALSSVTELGSYVRVRSAEEIRATLDRSEQRDGLMFMPEMYRWVGMRFRVAQRVKALFEYEADMEPPRPLYILEGLHCSGAVLGRRPMRSRVSYFMAC